MEEGPCRFKSWHCCRKELKNGCSACVETNLFLVSTQRIPVSTQHKYGEESGPSPPQRSRLVSHGSEPLQATSASRRHHSARRTQAFPALVPFPWLPALTAPLRHSGGTLELCPLRGAIHRPSVWKEGNWYWVLDLPLTVFIKQSNFSTGDCTSQFVRGGGGGCIGCFLRAFFRI